MAEQKQKQGFSLLELLAKGSTAESRALLRKYNQPDAKNFNDLAKKLSDLYLKHPSKVDFEKELVSIHPHKDLILRYSKKENTAEIPESFDPIEILADTKSEKEITGAKEEKKSGCDACSINAGKSSADGNSDLTAMMLENSKQSTINHRILIGGAIGVTALGLLLYFKKI